VSNTLDKLGCSLIILCIIALAKSSFAQTSKIQSIRDAIASSNNEQDQADLYADLADLLYSYDFEEGVIHAKTALKLSIKNDY